MNILIGIWKDENGETYYKCTNCTQRSTASKYLLTTMRKARRHQRECPLPERWTNAVVDGKPQTLIGIEMISL